MVDRQRNEGRARSTGKARGSVYGLAWGGTRGTLGVVRSRGGRGRRVGIAEVKRKGKLVG